MKVITTADGGYIIAGNSGSGIGGDKSQVGFGLTDYWVLKLSSTGDKQWDRTFGGDNQDLLQAVVQTASGDYLVAGYTYSDISGNKSAGYVGNPSVDYWVVKVDANGNKIRDKTYGGGIYDRMSSIALTFEGGFILGG